MKKLLVSSFLLGGILIACAEKQPVPAIPSDPEIEGKIEKLLKNLTLEEKIGQMCELTIGVITDKSGQKLSEDLLDTVIGKYKVGSILNIPFGVSQKKEVFADVITQIQKKSLEEIRIPCIYGLDQIHGASYTQDATFFPQGINMAATFNRELTKRCAEITAYETRACCVSWTYAPVMDLGRDPRWPRMWESFGEDAYVNAQMAVQAVRGLQETIRIRWINIIFPLASSILWVMAYLFPVKIVHLLLLLTLICVRNILLLFWLLFEPVLYR